MSTTEEKSQETFTRKCPSFFNIFHENDFIRPKLYIGITAVINHNLKSILHASHFNNIYLLNKVMSNSVNPFGSRFGIMYLKKNDIEGKPDHDDVDALPSSTGLFAETDWEGNFAGEAQLQVTENVRATAQTLWSSSENRTRAILEWARARTNLRLDVRADARKQVTCALEPAIRLGRWWCGGQLLFADVGPSFPRPGLSGALRYEGDAATVSAVFQQHTSYAALRYRRRVNDWLTVGMEIDTTPWGRMRAVKTTWIHSIALDNGIVIKGELDTNGIVSSEISKNFPSNITIGVCSLLNHKTNSFNVGLEFRSGAMFPHV